MLQSCFTYVYNDIDTYIYFMTNNTYLLGARTDSDTVILFVTIDVE